MLSGGAPSLLNSLAGKGFHYNAGRKRAGCGYAMAGGMQWVKIQPMRPIRPIPPISPFIGAHGLVRTRVFTARLPALMRRYSSGNSASAQSPVTKSRARTTPDSINSRARRMARGVW